MKLRIGDKVKHINHPQFGVGEVVNTGPLGAEVVWERNDRATYHLYIYLNPFFYTTQEALERKQRDT